MTTMEQPEQTILDVSEAISRGDIERALACYEPSAIFVSNTGEISDGVSEVRGALEAYISLSPTLEVIRTRKTIVNEEIALVACDWVMRGTDPTGQTMELNGTNIDVLRKRADGRWLLVIDNPFGLNE